MGDPEDGGHPVRAKAAVIDPESMTVLWTNDADEIGGADPGRAIEEAVPMAEALGVPEAVAAVAATGEPRHLTTDLISSGRGSAVLAVSVYRLPDGAVLVLSEHSWRAERANSEKNARGPRRRSR